MLFVFVLILAIKADERMVNGIVGHVSPKRLAVIASRAKVNPGKNAGILDLVYRCGETRKVPEHSHHGGGIGTYRDFGIVAKVVREHPAGSTAHAGVP